MKRKRKKATVAELCMIFSVTIQHMSKWIPVISLLSHQMRVKSLFGPWHSSYHSDFYMGGYSFLSHLFALSSQELDKTRQYPHPHHVLNNKCKAYDLLVPAEHTFRITIEHFSPR